jgi:hypothetical protein
MAQYEKGIFIGKFYPLHEGHLATLRKLAEASNEAFLIFYNDPRAESKLAFQLGTDYDIHLRIHDAQEIVKDIKNVAIKVLNIPPEITFPKDFLKIKSMIEEQIGGEADVQIFGAEEESIYLPFKYTDSYMLSPPYEVENEEGIIVSLHATAIRNNYPFYKKYLPAQVKRGLDTVKL